MHRAAERGRGRGGRAPVTAPGTELAAGSSSGATLRSLFPPRAAVRAGEAVRLAVEAARAHVFDAVTGRALWHPEDRSDGETG